MTHKRDELLSHEADGIREFDNALPRWWLYGFYLTIVFAVLYFTNYHVLPRPLVGHATLVAEYTADVARNARPTPDAGAGGASGLVFATDAETLAKGQAIFESPATACAACHRPDLGGVVGPNLTDDHWLHGCSPSALVANVTSGFPQKGMLPFGTGQRLSDEDLLSLVSYIASKRGSAPPAPKTVDPARDLVCP